MEKFLYIISVFVILFIIPSTSTNPFKRYPKGDKINEILLRQITSFPIKNFATDPQFVQKIDKANRTSSYMLIEEENKETKVYVRHQEDTNKDVIVLSTEEDKIPFKKTKRIFVVLKKNPINPTYFGTLAFLRPASPTEKETNPVKVDGVESVIEWTIYDDHLIPDAIPVTQFALSCVSSVLVPCFFNESVLLPSINYKKSTYKAKVPNTRLLGEIQAMKFKTYDNSDPNKSKDFFTDLAINKAQGESINDQMMNEAVSDMVKGVVCEKSEIECGSNITGQFKNLLGKRRRKRETAKDYSGWKTQYNTPSRRSYFKREDLIFFGFGNCPYTEISNEVLLKQAATVDNFVNFYLTVLRAGCISTMRPLIDKVIQSGLIGLESSEKIFDIRTNHKFLTQPKLLLSELLQLTIAFEFTSFTNIYKSFASKPPSHKFYVTPSGKQCSRSVHVISTVILDYLKTIRDKGRLHMIQLSRSMLQNTNAILLKLSQDSVNLEKCGKSCGKGKEVNFNDRMYMMGLNQMIKNGMGPVDSGTVDIEDAFNKFYIDNENAIDKYVQVLT